MRTEKDSLSPGTRMTSRSRLLALYLDLHLRGETIEDSRLTSTDLLNIMRDRQFCPEQNPHLDLQEVADKIDHNAA